ncbi:MAG: 16S rRNA (cytosine(1402)-N(4))-methyltransferase, partial [Gammaproteobacteria bacterium]|nr:16S rRNA (cytosine(1402)-N(4))-methyltransferase [Gammaproteobacteria bacterium]
AELPQVPPHARPRLRLIGGAVTPGAAEIARNPRARSAVLRVAERVAA